MRHERVTDEIRERAALHAIGMLEPEQGHAFEEHLGEGCAVCESELRAFRETASLVPAALPLQRPHPRVREKLLHLTGTGAIPKGLQVVRDGQGQWQETGFSGVKVKQLYADAAQDTMTMLVRMEPGATYAAHRHAAPEQCFVLEGDLHFGDLVFRAGDYQCASAQSTHSVSHTVGGCLLLIGASQHDELLA